MDESVHHRRADRLDPRGRALLLVGLIFALTLACSKGSTSTGGTTTPTTPSPTPTPTPTPSTGTWATEGTRLTNAQVGFSGVLADTSSIQLTDGRWRMFYFAGNRYRSAVSSDGLSFQVEPGERLREGQGHIRVLRLEDGRVRAYFISRGGISSAISSDEGVTFMDETGERIPSGSGGTSQVSGCSIARTEDGRWRMYFSDLPVPGAAITTLRILSAVSSDLLSWSLDPGVRIGSGATLSGSGEHPFALANTDGSISLFYFRNTNLTLMTSTSDDGLTFTTESSTGITQANDPDIVRVGGSLRMYYNWGDDVSGSVFSATRAAGSLMFVPTAPIQMGAPATPGGRGRGLFQEPARPQPIRKSSRPF